MAQLTNFDIFLLFTFQAFACCRMFMAHNFRERRIEGYLGSHILRVGPTSRCLVPYNLGLRRVTNNFGLSCISYDFGLSCVTYVFRLSSESYDFGLSCVRDQFRLRCISEVFRFRCECYDFGLSSVTYNFWFGLVHFFLCVRCAEGICEWSFDFWSKVDSRVRSFGIFAWSKLTELSQSELVQILCSRAFDTTDLGALDSDLWCFDTRVDLAGEGIFGDFGTSGELRESDALD